MPRSSRPPLIDVDRGCATEPAVARDVRPSWAGVPLSSMVVVWSDDLREVCLRFELDPAAGSVSVGRGEACDVLLSSPRVSRLHATLQRRGERWWVVDHGSLNGTYVNDGRVTEAPLAAGDRVRFGSTVMKHLSGDDAETEYFSVIRAAMVTDGLTGALTHAAFRERLDAEYRRARRYSRPLSLVMIDLDYFKSVNDQHGHLAGDSVLRAVAGVILRRVRREESVGRLGGEEFAVALPETPLQGARALARDLQRRIADALNVVEGASITVTASLGVAELTEAMKTPEALIERCDKLLYEAKNAGRNRLVVDAPE